MVLLTFLFDLPLATVIGLALGLAAITWLAQAMREPYDLEITVTKLSPPAWLARPVDSTQSVASLKLVFLSDLHAEWIRIRPDRLAAAVLDAHPDAIIFGGDLTGRQFKSGRAKPWLAAIQAAAQVNQTPCFAVKGNHDSAASLELMQQHGFTLLINQSVHLNGRDQSDWLLAGLDVLKAGRPDAGQALADAGSYAMVVPVSQRIILAHNPDTLLQIPRRAAAYFLAGHFHGGQLFMPFHLEFVLLRREKIGRLGYHKGAFEYHDLSCYISRGLGSVLFPLRFKSRPELAILELDAPMRQSEPDE